MFYNYDENPNDTENDEELHDSEAWRRNPGARVTQDAVRGNVHQAISNFKLYFSLKLNCISSGDTGCSARQCAPSNASRDPAAARTFYPRRLFFSTLFKTFFLRCAF